MIGGHEELEECHRMILDLIQMNTIFRTSTNQHLITE